MRGTPFCCAAFNGHVVKTFLETFSIISKTSVSPLQSFWIRPRRMASSLNTDPSECIEINVPTPWGHLATKCWNLSADELKTLPARRPVICLHGWQDNANTFDRLIPLLDRRIPFICLDFGGHGLSSARPLGSIMDLHMYVWDVRRVVDHFGLSANVSLLGHSLGGITAITFSACFPDFVDRCVTIDGMAPTPRDSSTYPDRLAAAIDKNVNYEKLLRPAPRYTRAEALERFLKAREVHMEIESANILLDRGLRLVGKSPDDEPLYEYARDFRVTFPSMISMTRDQSAAFVSKVRCHLLYIGFKDNYYESELAYQSQPDVLTNLKKMKELVFFVYESNCQSFQRYEVAGDHHTHLDHPERIAETTNAFLMADRESKL